MGAASPAVTANANANANATILIPLPYLASSLASFSEATRGKRLQSALQVLQVQVLVCSMLREPANWDVGEGEGIDGSQGSGR